MIISRFSLVVILFLVLAQYTLTNPAHLKPILQYTRNAILPFFTSAAFFCTSVPNDTFQLVKPVYAITRNDVKYLKSSSGVDYYDYKLGDGLEAKLGDKVTINIKGYLAGRQGWLYENTFDTEDPVRLVLGQTPCIQGLQIGIVGTSSSASSSSNSKDTSTSRTDDHNANDTDMPPMKKGGKRRLLIPSRLAYQNMNQEPIPRTEDFRRRLYSTVLNSERGTRETAAFGDSIVGKIILDVELLRVKSM